MKKNCYILLFILIGHFVSAKEDLKKIEVKKENFKVRCFDVGISFGIISVSTTVCCWSTSAHSPKYDCSWGNRTKQNIQDFGYIDVEKLDISVLDEINKKKLTKIKISKSSIGSDEGQTFKVVDGEYNIENGSNGRFIKVNIIINPS